MKNSKNYVLLGKISIVFVFQGSGGFEKINENSNEKFKNLIVLFVKIQRFFDAPGRCRAAR